MQRQGQSKIILLIMGTAIVLAAVLSLAVSNIRNRPPATGTGEQVLVAGQPITLRRNPAMTVRISNPEQPPIQPPPPVATFTPTVPPPEPATPTPPGPQTVPTFTPTSPPPVSVNSVILVPYTVKQQDTLYNITTQLVTSIALMAEYGISQSSLDPNVTIQVPVGNPAFCPNLRPYAVGEDDNVFRISQKMNTTKEEIQRLNNLDANFSIQAGQILCVP